MDCFGVVELHAVSNRASRDAKCLQDDGGFKEG
jgi:hypothetical protein